MKIIFFSKKKPLALFLFICALTTALSLSLICLDCEKYNSAEMAVPASLTFTPPKEPEEMGFWDIISGGIEKLLCID